MCEWGHARVLFVHWIDHRFEELSNLSFVVRFILLCLVERRLILRLLGHHSILRHWGTKSLQLFPNICGKVLTVLFTVKLYQFVSEWVCVCVWWRKDTNLHSWMSGGNASMLFVHRIWGTVYPQEWSHFWRDGQTNDTHQTQVESFNMRLSTALSIATVCIYNMYLFHYFTVYFVIKNKNICKMQISESSLWQVCF